jgi:hypothetical protein
VRSSFGVRDEDEKRVIYAENELLHEIPRHGTRKNGAGTAGRTSV